NAVKYDRLTHQEILEQGLGVMDSTAAAMCKDNDIPIHVFALSERGNVRKAIMGEPIGTIIV
ncbi:MAG: UMP kinase, partial [Clostridiales Family XIII bacterium]|nr:UMP kinase [Clostridiales Family XIII bacterium]